LIIIYYLTLFSLNSLKRAVRKVQAQGRPRAPADLKDLGSLPAAYSKLDGKDWLRLDTGEGDGDRMLLFYTDHGRQTLALSFYWMGDGNHGVSPKSALQLYVIFAGIIHHKNRMVFIPACYALMTSKMTLDSQVQVKRLFHPESSQLQERKLRKLRSSQLQRRKLWKLKSSKLQRRKACKLRHLGEWGTTDEIFAFARIFNVCHVQPYCHLQCLNCFNCNSHFR
jgi:hypothetical protein